MAEDKWTEKGIMFKVPNMDDSKQVETFLENYFFADEPVFRGMKLWEGNGWVDKYFRNLVRKMMVKEGLKDETSLMAINGDGEIVGCRLGATFDKNTKRDPKFKWLCPYPAWLVPKKLMILAYMSKFFDQLRYGKDWAFEDVPNATKFYNGLSLTVSSKARGLGLGSELIQRTNVYAKKWNCSHVYIGASSKYSQAIFKKIGFDVLHEAQYSGFKGKDGTDLFKDMREHKVCQVVLLDLKNVSETF